MRALIVEDSPEIRDLIALLMEGLGFETLQEEDGKAGLRALKKAGKIDVVLVDLYMPVMDGFEFIQAVRADPALQKTPIMMVTTDSGQSNVQRALELGANEYVMKPFTRDMIQAKLRFLGVLKD